MLLAGLLAVWPTVPAAACGPDSDCRIGDRHYRIRMPAGHDGKTPVGAIVHAHGYTGNARQAMRSKGFAAMARRMNMALISTKSSGRDWSLPGSPSHNKIAGADELAYYDRVLDDAARRFAIDRKRLIATGFSAGGMMVWNLACHRSEQFALFVPIAGTFWEPLPATCTSPPANVVHVHGDSDKTVPLKGRPIRDTHQGNVFRAIEMYAEFGRFGPPSAMTLRGLRCQLRRNSGGRLLTFCLYKGGHSFYIRHIRQAWDLLVKASRS